jgi:hypothetical protein
MSGRAGRGWVLRLAALLAAGTFGVHQARYALGYHEEASRALADQGHAYLIALGPLVAGLVMLALAALLHRVARGAAAPAPPFRVLWPSATLALAVTYGVQESVEGALAAHHPAGVAAVLGHGGWVALPLAVVVGLAVALAMRGATAAAGLRPAVARRPWPLPAAPLRLAAPCFLAAPRPGAALTRAARGPPRLAL